MMRAAANDCKRTFVRRAPRRVEDTRIQAADGRLPEKRVVTLGSWLVPGTWVHYSHAS